MKWSIGALMVLGLCAALAAAVLVNTFRQQSGRSPVLDRPPLKVTVVRAARDLPAMTVLDADALVAEPVAAGQAPEGSFQAPMELIGKTTGASVQRGQVLTRDMLAHQTGAILAAKLPAGKRAVTLTLKRHAALDGLIYSGCLVDVVATFQPPPAPDGQTEVASTTLLERIPVLAINGRTADSPAPKATDEAAQRPSNSDTLITLLVDTADAEPLQLAAEHGTIALAMRNPHDAHTRPRHSATTLSELSANHAGWFGRTPPSPPIVHIANIDAPPPATQPAPVVAAPPQWNVTVIRGSQIETQSFPPASTSVFDKSGPAAPMQPVAGNDLTLVK